MEKISGEFYKVSATAANQSVPPVRAARACSAVSLSRYSPKTVGPLPDIMVIGHTDTVGGLEYNDRLSRARAERLRDLLAELGIPAARIEAAGRGKRELLVPTEENVSEARNRRVEINVR